MSCEKKVIREKLEEIVQKIHGCEFVISTLEDFLTEEEKERRIAKSDKLRAKGLVLYDQLHALMTPEEQAELEDTEW